MGSSPERLHREERSGQPPVLRADRFNTVRPRPGRGRKVNVLDSFGYRMRVVITSEGVEGLPAVDWVHARMSEDSAGLIERCLNCWRDPDRQNRQRATARKPLESYRGPRPTVDAVERIDNGMLDMKGKRGF